jgi:UDP-GlcNAc3NAcA epimerase
MEKFEELFLVKYWYIVIRMVRWQASCLTLREETEWVELVEQGFNLLVGHDENIIAKAMTVKFPHTWKAGIYGDGEAAYKIVNEIECTQL